MARWGAVVPTLTLTAVADTTAFTASGYHALVGGSTTQRGEIREIYLGGQATSSAPLYMVFGRDVSTGTTPTAARLAALDPSTAALAAPPISFITAPGGQPQRSATLGMLLNLSFNAFGGIVRWYAGPDEVISYLGNTASLGELSLTAFTGSTASTPVGTNIVFETL